MSESQKQEKTRKTHKKTGRGPIDPNTTYPLEQFKELAGLGNHAMRTARRDGLVVRRVHGRSYVLGSDFLEYLKRVTTEGANVSQQQERPGLLHGPHDVA